MSDDHDWVVECLRSIDLGGPHLRLMVRRWRVVGYDETPPPRTYWFELEHADGVDRADSLGHLAVVLAERGCPLAGRLGQDDAAVRSFAYMATLLLPHGRLMDLPEFYDGLGFPLDLTQHVPRVQEGVLHLAFVAGVREEGDYWPRGFVLRAGEIDLTTLDVAVVDIGLSRSLS
jgi:hypothetical protein